MMKAVRSLAAIVFVAALGLGLPYAGAIVAVILNRHAPGIFPAPPPQGSQLGWLYSQHLFQTVWALIVIALVRSVFRFDAGLRWPQEKTYIWSAILWGAFFGVLMTVVDYLPDLLVRHPMDLGFPLTRANVIGWTFFEGVYVGPTEEILFRSLCVGFLMAAMPWKLTVGRYSMSWAGVIVAAIFAFAHIASFFTRPSFAAAGQQLYAFALGILYAYWFEKSRSVVAPIIGHNVSDVVEYAICFALIALWS
jgi:membrane protease YdiL (CAAX protease family)